MAYSFADGREIFSLKDFVENFSFERVSLGGPVFDLKKLLWLNGRYLREFNSDAQFVTYLQNQLFSNEYLSKIVPLVKERVEKSEDFIAYADFFFSAQTSIDANLLLLKDLSAKATIEIYEKLLDNLESLVIFDKASLEQCLRIFCEQNNVKTKDLFMPVRLMVTGKKATPPLFETMEVLGKERCRTRIRASIAAIRNYEER
jgi:glutamyl-tRNA synthetase